MIALWDHKTNVTQTMLANFDTHIRTKDGKGKTAERLWGQRGSLLLPTRVRLNTVRTLSVRLPEPVIGSAWVPCKPGSEIMEKALCAYLNSSVGILAMLGNRSNKIPSYPQFSIDDMRKLVVPDFANIGGNAAEQLAEAYDTHARDVLDPLPKMNDDPIRHALDAAVIKALGLNPEMVHTIRRELAMEPSITGQQYGRQA